MNRIYCAVGKIFEVTQKIEELLGEICEQSEIIKEFSRHSNMTAEDYRQVVEDSAYLKEKMQSMTMGEVISIVGQSKSLSYDEGTELRKLLERRNYFAHEYFKLTPFEKFSETDIVDEFEALKEHLKKLKQMQNRLELIFDGGKQRLKFLKDKYGLQ